ncbi:MAG: hypothetical protein R3315_01730 [Woeseiaceae bacterium]|nr:hypothetical protein [Woeseiaceae bacterium]
MSSYIERQSGTTRSFGPRINEKNKRYMSQDRRNDYDVTNTVRVSDPVAVRDAVHELFAHTYPGKSYDKIWLAFYDFERLFNGRYPGYLGCDTTYHDLQHTLDMTLALARLIAGHEMTAEAKDRLGPERAQMTIITSLFHDSGYIRHVDRDRDFENGAEFSLQHVSRSADFLRRYLPEIGLSQEAIVSSMIVHFTGYEVDLDDIELDDPRDVICGHLLGTADLIAQMADRCYLEKCRDRLYKEFVLGGIAIEAESPRDYVVRYQSGKDLLRKTPVFYQQVTRDRLKNKFSSAYRYVEPLFDGQNPYVEAIRKNIAHLVRVLKANDWRLLRRNPPFNVISADTVRRIDDLVAEHLASVPPEVSYAQDVAGA